MKLNRIAAPSRRLFVKPVKTSAFKLPQALKSLGLITSFVCAAGFALSEASVANAQTTSRRAPAAASKTTPQTAARPATARVAKVAQNAAPQAVANAQNAASQSKLTPEEEAKFQEAVQRFNNQDVAGALAALREIAANNPKAIPPRLILASWFAELKNRQAVRVSLEAATDESPNDPEAFFSLAEISLLEGGLTAAELLTKQGDAVLEQYNANPERKKNLTRKSLMLKLSVATARQRWTDAQTTILALIKLDGETAELDRALGRALFQQNQDAKAREMFLRADKLEPGKGLPADALLSQLYSARGDSENAKRCLDAALKAAPKSVPVLLLSIGAALEENDLDAAWKLVRQLYQEDKSADVLKMFGKVALFRADYAQAEAAFQEVVRQNPLDADAIGGLALALCEQDDAEKRSRAVQYATSNLQRQSNNRDFLATLGWTLYKSGDVDSALKALQQSVADGQINAAAAYYFAVVLNEKGQTDGARQLLDAALSTKPPFAKRNAAAQLRQSLGAAPQTSAPTK